MGKLNPQGWESQANEEVVFLRYFLTNVIALCREELSKNWNRFPCLIGKNWIERCIPRQTETVFLKIVEIHIKLLPFCQFFYSSTGKY